jgi:hypothetical protein
MLWFMLLLASAQDDPKVDQMKVDQAIARGLEFLVKDGTSPPHNKWAIENSHELLLFTFIHAGMSQTDPYFQKLLGEMLAGELKRTYSVSLQAMVLFDLDPAAYQGRIAQCAQFLADNQCANGQWSYGEPTTFLPPLPPKQASGSKGSTKVLRKVIIKKMKDGPREGDASNTQYAAMGLRACHDAGIVFSGDLLTKARDYWKGSQNGDGGWGYDTKRGDDSSYASMTASGVASLVLYHYMLKESWKKNSQIEKGLAWIADRFSTASHPGSEARGEHKSPKNWIYYYFYSLERAGVFYGTEKFGDHEWYPEGVKALLEEQEPDGSWWGKKAMVQRVQWDTCFAILFMKRASKPPVASTDRVHSK